MTAHLLLMTLGPVKESMAQSRRTRDLWFGSHVLSVLSHEAATAALRSASAELIFPLAPEGASTPTTGLPNKLLLLVKEGAPAAVARAAREAARSRLRAWGRKVWQERSQLVDPGAWETAQEQLDTFLEFYAAWSPLASEEKAEYANALRRVEEALSSRKRLRAFAPWNRQRGGIHKSSLDGARESVLRECERKGGDWRRFRIGRREQLDAMGLLKRTGGTPGQFVPVPTIGLAAYTAQAKDGPELEALKRECQRLRELGSLTGVRTEGRPWVEGFPFDAQLLLPGRWRAHLEEQEVPEEVVRRVGELVRPVLRKHGMPFPYVACLAADGDRMGQSIQTLAGHGRRAHQALSRALMGFAAEARRIIQERHRGVLVYAGGDDVLAFVCLPDALRCASELRQAFLDATGALFREHGVEAPTLSVGLGVGHVLESLGDLLELGRRAESLAKGSERDGLAVLARLHSSREHAWRGAWRDAPVESLSAAIALRRDRTLPLKKVQEVGALLQRMPSEGGPLGDDVEWGHVLMKEVERVLARVALGAGGEGLTPAQAGLAWADVLPLGRARARVKAWAECVFIAELFARAMPRARVEKGGTP